MQIKQVDSLVPLEDNLNNNNNKQEVYLGILLLTLNRINSLLSAVQPMVVSLDNNPTLTQPIPLANPNNNNNNPPLAYSVTLNRMHQLSTTLNLQPLHSANLNLNLNNNNNNNNSANPTTTTTITTLTIRMDSTKNLLVHLN
jgi:hypothetical protein